MALLGEQPSRTALIGGAVIMLGIAVGLYVKLKGRAAKPDEPISGSETVEYEGNVTFKGV